MKQKSIILGLIVALFTTTIWFSCHSDSITKTEISPEIVERIDKLGLDSLNKQLLTDFFTGDLTDLKGQKIQKFSVTLWHEMLAFKTKADAKNYLSAVEILKDKWNYRSKLKSARNESFGNAQLRSESDGSYETIENIGDDVLNAIDAAMGFQSLRRHYDLLAYYDDNWRNNLDYVADPELQSVFSATGNLMVQSEIFHFVDNNLVAMIQNQDLVALQEVVQDGFMANSPNLSFYDEFSGDVIEDGSGGPPPPPGACLLTITAKTRRIDNNFQTIRLERDVDNGASVICAGIETVVKWGDGNQTTIAATSLSQNHTYDFDPVMRTPQGKIFTITIEVTLNIACGDCPAGSKVSKTLTVNIKDPGEPCFTDRQVNASFQEFIPPAVIQDRGVYKMEIEHGQRGVKGNVWTGWAKEKVWATVKFYKWQNGKFRSFCPEINLEANLSGKIFVNDCGTELNIAPSPVTAKRDDCVEAIDKPNQTFGTRKTLPTMPIANGIARLNPVGTIRSINNFPLWQ